ncbi:MAG: DUF5615 family PIN-like protein [Anaerolineae bacterium]|nr:DUF5615 family PIN-like protein [Anaerolineae bacterium]
MKFYTDVHIHREVVQQLRNKGVEIIHCVEVEMQDAADLDHLVYATENGCVLISCDRDFEEMHWQWQTEGKTHAGIVFFYKAEQCQSISFIVNEILFLTASADYQTDLYNTIWRP